MKKSIISVLLVLGCTLVVLSFPQHWPRSSIQDLYYIWLKEEGFKKLLRILGESEYDRVWIANGEIYTAGILVDEDWQTFEKPIIPELIDELNLMGIKNVSLISLGNVKVVNNNFSDLWFYTKGDKQWKVQVDYRYRLGASPIEKQCHKELIESTESGLCFSYAFGDWKIEKLWHAIDTTSWTSVDDT